MATEIAVEGPAVQDVTMTDVPWSLYRELREISANRRKRMTYDNGTLIVMSPNYNHETAAFQLGHVILAVVTAAGQELAAPGGTTLWREGGGRLKGTGKEPDISYYFGANEERMRGKPTIDLSIDPPPDLVIEIDNKADSEHALPLYARLKVPEVWRYNVRNHTLWFGRLSGRKYATLSRSICLPKLTPAIILQALDECAVRDLGLVAWNEWLRDWARTLPEPPA